MTTAGHDFPVDKDHTQKVEEERRVDIWKEHGRWLEKITAHRALLTKIFAFFENTYKKILSLQDKLLNKFHRKHNSFLALNRVLETSDLIWLLKGIEHMVIFTRGLITNGSGITEVHLVYWNWVCV